MKRKLLIVTTRFPWPLNNGFSKKNFALVKGLADQFAIRLIVIQKQKPLSNDVIRVSNYCSSIEVVRPNIFDYLIGFIYNILRDKPLQFAFFYSRKAMRLINTSFHSHDIAICSVIRGAQYFEEYNGSLYNDLADSLGQVYLKDAAKFTGLKKLIYLEEGRRLLKYEKSLIEKSNKTFYFNNAEAAFFNSNKVQVLTHGLDEHLFSIIKVDKSWNDGVVFFGKMDFAPNVNAVFWFVDNVLKYLEESIKLYVVGYNPSSALIDLSKANSRVVVTGFIENPYEAMRGSIACICPIQTGGGIQNKVLESMAIGSLTVISKLAAIPFQDIDQMGLIVCDTSEDWVTAIQNIICRPTDFELNKYKSVRYAKKNYSWELYISEIKNELLNQK